MKPAPAGAIHAYLAGIGTDATGRRLDEVLALPDARLETIHDYIQWAFPLPTPSMAQPRSPVLNEAEIQAIRTDDRALANLDRAAARMVEFYERTDAWLTWSDHNHLRISRILLSLKILSCRGAADRFYRIVMARVEATGTAIDPRNRRYWAAALE